MLFTTFKVYHICTTFIYWLNNFISMTTVSLWLPWLPGHRNSNIGYVIKVVPPVHKFQQIFNFLNHAKPSRFFGWWSKYVARVKADLLSDFRLSSSIINLFFRMTSIFLLHLSKIINYKYPFFSALMGLIIIIIIKCHLTNMIETAIKHQ